MRASTRMRVSNQQGSALAGKGLSQPARECQHRQGRAYSAKEFPNWQKIVPTVKESVRNAKAVPHPARQFASQQGSSPPINGVT